MPQPSLRRLPGDPSPREIRALCERARDSWSPQERWSRSHWRDQAAFLQTDPDASTLDFGAPWIGTHEGDGW